MIYYRIDEETYDIDPVCADDDYEGIAVEAAALVYESDPSHHAQHGMSDIEIIIGTKVVGVFEIDIDFDPQFYAIQKEAAND